MNGQGDIELKNIPFEQYKEWTQDQKDWMHYNVLQSLSCTCHDRPKKCDKKYIKKKHLYVVFIAIIAFMMGYGVLEFNYFIPTIIKSLAFAGG